MTGDLVHRTIRDGVARIELDRPPVNAYDRDLVEALAVTVRALAASGAHAAVFSGRGPGLSAGGDIKWVHDRIDVRDDASLHEFLYAIQSLFDDIDALPMPTIAVLHGLTLGGGLETALACDLRIATEDARIGFPEATVGLIPAAGGTQRLTEIVGRSVALELMYSGRILDAEGAMALGILNRVAPASELELAVDDLLAGILRSTPSARAALKSCVRARIEQGRKAGLTLEREFAQQLSSDADTIERLAAFSRRSERKLPVPEPQRA